MNATTITKITAPKIDGTIAMSATFGPHSPKRAWPSEDPTNPAKILAIQSLTYHVQLKHLQLSRLLHQQLIPKSNVAF